MICEQSRGLSGDVGGAGAGGDELAAEHRQGRAGRCNSINAAVLFKAESPCFASHEPDLEGACCLFVCGLQLGRQLALAKQALLQGPTAPPLPALRLPPQLPAQPLPPFFASFCCSDLPAHYTRSLPLIPFSNKMGSAPRPPRDDWLAAKLKKHVRRSTRLLADLTSSSVDVDPAGREVVKLAAMPKTAIVAAQVRGWLDGRRQTAAVHGFNHQSGRL